MKDVYARINGAHVVPGDLNLVKNRPGVYSISDVISFCCILEGLFGITYWPFFRLTHGPLSTLNS